MAERRDFYFSAAEATSAYFASKFPGRVHEWRRADGSVIWATEVTAPGARPVSRSKDLLLVASDTAAEFVGNRSAKQGELWDSLEAASG